MSPFCVCASITSMYSVIHIFFCTSLDPFKWRAACSLHIVMLLRAKWCTWGGSDSLPSSLGVSSDLTKKLQKALRRCTPPKHICTQEVFTHQHIEFACRTEFWKAVHFALFWKTDLYNLVTCICYIETYEYIFVVPSGRSTVGGVLLLIRQMISMFTVLFSLSRSVLFYPYTCTSCLLSWYTHWKSSVPHVMILSAFSTFSQGGPITFECITAATGNVFFWNCNFFTASIGSVL